RLTRGRVVAHEEDLGKLLQVHSHLGISRGITRDVPRQGELIEAVEPLRAPGAHVVDDGEARRPPERPEREAACDYADEELQRENLADQAAAPNGRDQASEK